MSKQTTRYEKYALTFSVLAPRRDSLSTRRILAEAQQALAAIGWRFAPGKIEVAWADPNPRRKPHALASKSPTPCPDCGSHWVRPGLDTSRLDLDEVPVLSLCAYCGAESPEAAHA